MQVVCHTIQKGTEVCLVHSKCDGTCFYCGHGAGCSKCSIYVGVLVNEYGLCEVHRAEFRPMRSAKDCGSWVSLGLWLCCLTGERK